MNKKRTFLQKKKIKQIVPTKKKFQDVVSVMIFKRGNIPKNNNIVPLTK